MTVKEFRDFLETFPDDMQVLQTRCSDLGPMELSEWCAIQGIEEVSGRYGWVRRVAAMTDENRARVRTYLHFAGN